MIQEREQDCYGFFFRSKPFDDDSKSIRGYRQRMMQEWKEDGVFEITEQQLCDQARAIKKNGWDFKIFEG